MRNGWQSDRLLSGLAQELNAGRGSFENAVLHLRALITRVAPKDSVDPVTIALVGVLGDPEILRVEVRKLTTEARRVIATARKANVLGIPIPDSIPHDLGGQGTGEVQVPRSDMDRMLAGELYGASAPLIQTELAATQRWLVRYNAALDLSPAARRNLLLERLAAVGEVAVIRPPFHCDFGFNIRLGERVFLNVNCVILDAVEVMIGERTQIGPGVQILTVDRPRDPAVRASGPAFGRPVRVGRNVRIGAGAIILPGVSISDDAVIGAGSVVTRDVPAGATTFGNPARVRT
jgi:maltose O-acetyltransferase